MAFETWTELFGSASRVGHDAFHERVLICNVNQAWRAYVYFHMFKDDMICTVRLVTPDLFVVTSLFCGVCILTCFLSEMEPRQTQIIACALWRSSSSVAWIPLRVMGVQKCLIQTSTRVVIWSRVRKDVVFTDLCGFIFSRCLSHLRPNDPFQARVTPQNDTKPRVQRLCWKVDRWRVTIQEQVVEDKRSGIACSFIR